MDRKVKILHHLKVFFTTLWVSPCYTTVLWTPAKRVPGDNFIAFLPSMPESTSHYT